MNLYVHCTIIHSGQDMEKAEVPFNRALDKEDGVHILIHNEYYQP